MSIEWIHVHVYMSFLFASVIVCGEPQDYFPTDPGPSTSKPSDKMLISSVVPNWYLIPISINVNIDSLAIELLQNRLTLRFLRPLVIDGVPGVRFSWSSGRGGDGDSWVWIGDVSCRCSTGASARGSRGVVQCLTSRVRDIDSLIVILMTLPVGPIETFDIWLDTWYSILDVWCLRMMGSDLGMIPAE